MFDDVVGSTYGPFSSEISRSSVRDYVDATADDPGRWVEHAPPSLAGALLFVVAPALLADDRLETSSVIHGDQSFRWHRPIVIGTTLQVEGTVSRARERGGVYFVGFNLKATDETGVVLEGVATFLMAGDQSPGAGAEEEVEPPPTFGSVASPLELSGLPDIGEAIEEASRSASRADLVRYAAASHDFNPIHWDHGAAVAAGLPGIVVHGLLQSAWILQVAGRFSGGSAPLIAAKFRYRSPLRPATTVIVGGVHKGNGIFDLRLEGAEGVVVSANVEVKV